MSLRGLSHSNTQTWHRDFDDDRGTSITILLGLSDDDFVDVWDPNEEDEAQRIMLDQGDMVLFTNATVHRGCGDKEQPKDTNGGSPSSEPTENEPAPRRGTGGAWRSFVRQLRSNNLREVGEAYRRCTPEEKAELEEEGRAATQRGHAGHHASKSQRWLQKIPQTWIWMDGRRKGE